MPGRSADDHGQGEAIEDQAPAQAQRLPLTPRHLEILARVSRGRTNREVGEELGISERTVRNHMRTILHRLSSRDRTHAVVVAIGNGWIPIPIEPEPASLPALPVPAES